MVPPVFGHACAIVARVLTCNKLIFETSARKMRNKFKILFSTLSRKSFQTSRNAGKFLNFPTALSINTQSLMNWNDTEISALI